MPSAHETLQCRRGQVALLPAPCARASGHHGRHFSLGGADEGPGQADGALPAARCPVVWAERQGSHADPARHQGKFFEGLADGVKGADRDERILFLAF